MRLYYAARKKFPVPTALTVLTNFISVVCAFKVVSSTLSREYDLIFGNLGIAESEEVTNVTGCLNTPLLEPGKCWGKSHLPRAVYKL